MTVWARWSVAALLGAGAMSGCADYPPVLNPDAMTLAVLLEAGAREARMVAIHPHRSVGETSQWEGPAQWIVRDAVLRGPRWSVPFADTLEECGESGGRPPACARTRVELRAELPEPIAPAGTYVVEGEGVLGPFNCTIEVPASPVLLDMPDTVRVPRDTIIRVNVPFRYQAGPEVGFLSVVGEREATDGSRYEYVQLLPPFPNDTATIVKHYNEFFFFSLTVRIAGVGWNILDFFETPGELWHAQAAEAGGYDLGAGGVEGEGAYGYCDGVSYSRTAVIIAEEAATEGW